MGVYEVADTQTGNTALHTGMYKDIADCRVRLRWYSDRRKVTPNCIKLLTICRVKLKIKSDYLANIFVIDLLKML